MWFMSIFTRNVTMTYSATVLARETALGDGRVQPKHVVRKKGD